MTLAERIVRYRAMHDMSQTEFAEACKLSLQTVNSVENGLQNPSKLTVAKIEVVLGEEK